MRGLRDEHVLLKADLVAVYQSAHPSVKTRFLPSLPAGFDSPVLVAKRQGADLFNGYSHNTVGNWEWMGVRPPRLNHAPRLLVRSFHLDAAAANEGSLPASSSKYPRARCMLTPPQNTDLSVQFSIPRGPFMPCQSGIFHIAHSGGVPSLPRLQLRQPDPGRRLRIRPVRCVAWSLFEDLTSEGGTSLVRNWDGGDELGWGRLGLRVKAFRLRRLCRYSVC